MRPLRPYSGAALAVATLACTLYPALAVARTPGGEAVTAPSGETPRARSARCNRVANHRHLTGSARQEFRLDCLATAAPATHAATHAATPKPTAAKNELGVATEPQPH